MVVKFNSGIVIIIKTNVGHDNYPHPNTIDINAPTMPIQLPLQLRLPKPGANFQNYCCQGNETAYPLLQQLLKIELNPALLYLWGEQGVGKTHLLQAACASASAAQQTPVYLPLEQAGILSPDVLDELDQLDLVCLDNVEQIAGDADWEFALFKLFNQLQDKSVPLLLSAAMPVRQIPWQSADLSSRFNSGQQLQLHALPSSAFASVLEKHATAKGLKLTDKVSQYLIQRSHGQLSQLLQDLETLDYAALADKRRLSLSFVKQVL